MDDSKNAYVLIDFLRHGACADNAFLRGTTDSPLSDLGLQSMADALEIEGLTYANIISSPKQRCHTFAKIYAKRTQTQLKIINEWQERAFGDWDGASLETLQATQSNALTQYFDNPFTYAIPNAETLQDFSTRINQAWLALQQTALTHAQNTLVITHGGCLRMVLQRMLSMDNNGLFHLDLPYACRVRIAVYPSVNYKGNDVQPFAKLIEIVPL